MNNGIPDSSGSLTVRSIRNTLLTTNRVGYSIEDIFFSHLLRLSFEYTTHLVCYTQNRKDTQSAKGLGLSLSVFFVIFLVNFFIRYFCFMFLFFNYMRQQCK